MFDQTIMTIVLYLIVSIGIVGNILNLIVLSRSAMRKMTTFRFLLYLALIDLLVLIFCACDVLLTYETGLEIRQHSSSACRMHSFLTYCLTHMSSIVLMVISIERLIIIYGQDRLKQKLQTNKFLNKVKDYRIEIIILLVIILVALIDSHYLLYMQLNEISSEDLDDSQLSNLRYKQKIAKQVDKFILESNQFNATTLPKTQQDNELTRMMAKLIKTQTEKYPYNLSYETPFEVCMPIDSVGYNYFLNNYWIWIDISIYFLIPFFVMFLCSIFIYAKTKQQTKEFLVKFSQSNKKLSARRIRRKRKIFGMLVVTDVIFFLCLLPYCILYFKSSQSIPVSQNSLFSAQVLAYLNNSINFIIYVVFSKRFRQEISIIFMRKKHNLAIMSMRTTGTSLI